MSKLTSTYAINLLHQLHLSWLTQIQVHILFLKSFQTFQHQAQWTFFVDFQINFLHPPLFIFHSTYTWIGSFCDGLHHPWNLKLVVSFKENIKCTSYAECFQGIKHFASLIFYIFTDEEKKKEERKQKRLEGSDTLDKSREKCSF